MKFKLVYFSNDFLTINFKVYKYMLAYFSKYKTIFFLHELLRNFVIIKQFINYKLVFH